MRKLFPFFLLVASAALAVPAHAQEADVIVTMNSYGPVQIGMTIGEVRGLLQKMGRKDLPAADKLAKASCGHYRASDELQLRVEGGKVTRIATKEKFVVTPSGIRVGSSIERVRRALGSRAEDTQAAQASDANERSILLTSGDKRFAIRIEANPAVTEIQVGAEPAVRQAGGCA